VPSAISGTLPEMRCDGVRERVQTERSFDRRRAILPAKIANYNHRVARGWESKSVEAQQAEAEEKASGLRRKLSAQEAERLREKEGLRLARQRVLHQMEQSTDPRHRALLGSALADLDAKLSRLDD